MTLETCKIRLEISKKIDNKEDIAFWEERIARKTGYQEAPKTIPKTTSKPKEKE
jgi:hypothetical protein